MTEIIKESGRHSGRYFMDMDGEQPELTFIYIPLSDNIVANHTGVPQALRGQGLARQLVDAMIEDARTTGFKIVPQCPYIATLYQRHPEWSDVMMELPDWLC